MTRTAIALVMGILFVAALAAGPALADNGTTWFEAMKKGKGAAAAKVTVPTGLKYGVDGTDRVITEKIAKHYSKLFKKLRKTFKGAELQAGGCTQIGRELGYMAGEWKEKSETVADWIRKLPDAFCTGVDMKPPKVWLVKLLDGDLPHAIVLFQTGEDQLITGFYHF